METSARSVRALRPLGVGEILDRAVTLCVRNFPTLALIYLLFAVPLAIFQYLGTEDQSRVFGALAQVLQKQSSTGHAADPNAWTKAIGGQPIFNGWTGMLLVWLFLVSPLPAAALTLAVGAFYLGGKIDLGAAYRAALGRWPQLIMYNILWIFCAILLYVILVVGLVVLFIGLALVTTALHGVGVAIDVIVGILVGCLTLAFILVMTLAYEVGFFSCVIERVNFATAFASGFQRVFSRAGMTRTLLAGLAFFAIGIGIYIVMLIGQAVLFGLVRSNVLGIAYATIVSVATAAFSTAYIGIFYFDLRVRKEGLDLELAAADARLAAPSPV